MVGAGSTEVCVVADGQCEGKGWEYLSKVISSLEKKLLESSLE